MDSGYHYEEGPGYPVGFDWYSVFPAGAGMLEPGVRRKGKLLRLPKWFKDVHCMEALVEAINLTGDNKGLGYMMMLDYQHRKGPETFDDGDFMEHLGIEDEQDLLHLVPQDGSFLDRWRPADLDQLNRELQEAQTHAEPRYGESQLRLIGNRWEFLGGVTPPPPATVLKPYGVPKGVPSPAVYPPTRTVQEEVVVRPVRPPRAVYPPP
jgi:hypothetical protein